ncbi:MAG: CrcB family protein [Methanomassiliicoccaceae archaeon]|jgi:CrcB protein|nr:CrcB family protein [Methanomassiliicoccaceae archaeon]
MEGDRLIYVALVALGGAVGAVLRYGAGHLFTSEEGIAWDILLVNFVGCFLICLLFFKFADMGEATRLFLFVGIFGAFTTMSAVSLETMRFFAEGQIGYALAAFLLNASVCVGGGFLGKVAASVL